MPPLDNSPFAKRIRDASRPPSRERPTTPTRQIFGIGTLDKEDEDDERSIYLSSPSRNKGKRKMDYGDRYIPNRDDGDLRTSYNLMDAGGPSSPSKQTKVIPTDSDATQEQANASFNTIVRKEFEPGPSSPSRRGRSSGPPSAPSTPARKRILNFGSPATETVLGLDSTASPAYALSPVHPETSAFLQSPQKTLRHVNKTPYRVLDAPDLQDDFYMDLVHWSSTNILAVGLGSCVYLWAAHTAEVTKLCDLSEADTGAVTSLSWVQKGSTLAIGTSTGHIHIYDAPKAQLLRTYHDHSARVGAMSWNSYVLSSGSRDRTIQHHDVRAAGGEYRRLTAHRQEVCGLRWSGPELGGNGGGYLASGGNDNALYVWDARWDSMGVSSSAGSATETDSRPLWKFREHKAAVKAIAWSPHLSGVLASGGGTQDKKIITWNTTNGQIIHELDTGSQVCNLIWSQTTHELVSTHGYSSTSGQNQVILWRFPSMEMLATLSGHTHRVLYLAMSPDGQTIVTGAGDETLRFWDVFPRKAISEGSGGPGTPSTRRRKEAGRLAVGGQIR
ncbi:WD40 repeat-like protein [Sistotremastrum suecicum HHB10207 ss-3]|uniref:WD40 repeat-like protein n=1 Tax=Sistotremastrum suecicum HHB10207 ss-3 TaxID=1314776 RepID=A0A165XT98_9AGAM|nr:WD40 repeat-like protein [Sistotremastrum suecicum HHB10207 ss-3]